MMLSAFNYNALEYHDARGHKSSNIARIVNNPQTRRYTKSYFTTQIKYHKYLINALS